MMNEYIVRWYILNIYHVFWDMEGGWDWMFSVPVCGEEGIYCVYVLSVELLIIKYDAESIPDSSDCWLETDLLFWCYLFGLKWSG